MTPEELEDMVIAQDGIPGGCPPGGAISTGRWDCGRGLGKAGSIAEEAEGEKDQFGVDDSKGEPPRSDKLRLKQLNDLIAWSS